ncbi:MAG: hypothetical protein PHV74_11115 [Dehalococcoidia bacterium]|nr:hypothetical protein [Dehalococcoidia bacterium]
MGDGNKGSGFVGGFIIGGVVGIAVGYLFSEKGREALREAIKQGREAAARREAEVLGGMEKEDLV